MITMTDSDAHSGNGAGSSSTSRVDDAYRRLRGLIVHGQIAPGSRIIETEVAEQIGVSRTPVSAALQRLAQEGVVEADSRNGGRSRRRIAPLTGENARELMYLLGNLESLAASRVAEFEDERRRQVVDDLLALNGRMENEANTEPPARGPFLDIDVDFHRTFVEAGGGRRLRKLHESYVPQAERYFRHYVVTRQYSLDRSLEEHEEIIEAIGSGDLDVASGAVRQTWRNAEKRLQQAIERAGERGTW